MSSMYVLGEHRRADLLLLTLSSFRSQTLDALHAPVLDSGLRFDKLIFTVSMSYLVLHYWNLYRWVSSPYLVPMLTLACRLLVSQPLVPPLVCLSRF
jgi:hypothetical protein